MRPHAFIRRFSALVALLCFAGCSARLREVTARPDVLRVSYPNDPDTLNPLTAGDAVSDLVQSFVYEALAERNLAEPDELLPRLAEKWEFDEERLEFTIRLRRGVQWHPITLPNGATLPSRELTTRDVQFTFDCLLNPHI